MTMSPAVRPPDDVAAEAEALARVKGTSLAKIIDGDHELLECLAR
jgi:hypothetical protein